MYSKLSIIRPNRPRLLEFEKKDSTGRLIEIFSKYPDQVIYYSPKIGRGSPDIKQYDPIFLIWTWSSNKE